MLAEHHGTGSRNVAHYLASHTSLRRVKSCSTLGHHFFDKWREDVWSAGALESESGGKLVLYRQFKCMPELEPYAKAHIPLAARRVLAGLRAGCLPLQVELGRFTCPKTPYKQRLCKLCGEAPEDQTHFLLMCPKLN